MAKSVYQLNQERKTDYKYDDFPVGMPVQVMCVCQDFNFFDNETGVVVKNTGGYLGIGIKFDKPRHFEGGYIQKDFNFNPSDLKPLKEKSEIIKTQLNIKFDEKAIIGGVVTYQDLFKQFALLAEFMGENNLTQEKVLEILKWHLNK